MPEIVDQIKRNRLLASALIVFTLAIGILIGTVVSPDVGAARKDEPVAPDATPLTIPPAEPLENEFSRIAQEVRPSVVNIRVTILPQRSERAGDERQEGMEEFFRRFFGMPEGPGPRTPPRDFRRPGEGSGVVVDKNGYIITNHHVVDEADRIQVRFSEDEKLYDAKLIGQDEETDLAVIKLIDYKGKLVPAKIGNSDAVRVGDWAIAVGSPFGFRETVTAGIISAKAREVQSAAPFQRPFQQFLQTDAAINPGNSGGPLMNIRGEVIGINTAIVSRSGGYEGLGFALASNIAVDVYNQIIQHGRVARGSIGITFQTQQDEALLRTYGVEGGGVFVREVTEDGPAQHAGMKAEDVIVEIDGKRIRDGNELINTVASLKVGSTVPIVVVRDGERITLNVEIADRAELFADELGLSRPEDEGGPADTEVMFGISVTDLSRGMRQQLQYDEEGGVLITEVEPASFADDLGLQPQDIVVEINRKPVRSVSDIRGIQSELKPGDDVVFKIKRRLPGPGGSASWETQYLADVLPEPNGDRF